MLNIKSIFNEPEVFSKAYECILFNNKGNMWRPIARYFLYAAPLPFPSTHNTQRLKVKGKVHPKKVHEGPKVAYRYSSTLSLTSALYRGGWSTPRPLRFTPGKDPVLNVYT
jgi:hypothetical protein